MNKVPRTKLMDCGHRIAQISPHHCQQPKFHLNGTIRSRAMKYLYKKTFQTADAAAVIQKLAIFKLWVHGDS